MSTQRYYPDYISDQWWQAALTVEGHVSNFDITYAAGYLNRNDHTSTDYSDYTLLYDKNTTYMWYLQPPNITGNKLINSSQYILGTDQYRKISQELRVATPKENRLRFIGGALLRAPGALHPAELSHRSAADVQFRHRLAADLLADRPGARRS